MTGNALNHWLVKFLIQCVQLLSVDMAAQFPYMYSIKSIKPPWRKQYVSLKLTKVSIINGEILCGINEMLYWISSSKLLFLFNLAHYERLFKDLQAQIHGEPVTGLLMIYPHHMIHVVEVRGLNGLILARLWDFRLLSMIWASQEWMTRLFVKSKICIIMHVIKKCVKLS